MHKDLNKLINKLACSHVFIWPWGKGGSGSGPQTVLSDPLLANSSPASLPIELIRTLNPLHGDFVCGYNELEIVIIFLDEDRGHLAVLKDLKHGCTVREYAVELVNASYTQDESGRLLVVVRS